MDIFSKILKFLKEASREMKKITWPKRKEVFNYTLIVLGTSVAVALILGFFDFIFFNLFERIIVYRFHF
jgi:preprotein translocase subunit SecE